VTAAAGTLRVSLDATAVPVRPVGAGQYTIGLISALAMRDDLDLTVYCRHGDDGRWVMLAPTATLVAAAPQPRPARLLWEQTVLPVLMRRRRADVHHGPHYTMPELARLPRVVTVHDLTFFDHPEWHERTKIPVFRRAIKVAARRAAAIVCVSEYTAERLHALLAVRCPVHVIHHGIDHRRFNAGAPGGEAADDTVLARLGVRPPFVAFVGTLEPRKAVDQLVLAFDRMAGAHSDLRLVLAGTRGWGTEAVDAAIAAARHGDRIVRTGYVPDEAVPALFRRAAAVAYPSAEEGFGMPALEALSCGAPLVTTKGSVMEDVVGEAALLVPPGDVRALSGALDMVVRGDAALATRQARGRAIAERHTWQACADRHVAVYRSVLSDR
jgi:glycosyltransferase involved in cell wall biosynthesis